MSVLNGKIPKKEYNLNWRNAQYEHTNGDYVNPQEVEAEKLWRRLSSSIFQNFQMKKCLQSMEVIVLLEVGIVMDFLVIHGSVC